MFAVCACVRTLVYVCESVCACSISTHIHTHTHTHTHTCTVAIRVMDYYAGGSLLPPMHGRPQPDQAAFIYAPPDTYATSLSHGELLKFVRRASDSVPPQ